MALHLSDWVDCGELFNTHWYSVHGWLQLRGREQPVMLQLTGNCAPDLAGWHIRFHVPEDDAASAASGDAASSANATRLARLAWEQIGPTGLMTTAQRSGAAALRLPATLRSETIAGRRRLYLEWFSQDGHMVVDLPDAVIECVEFTPHTPPQALGNPPDSGCDVPCGELPAMFPRWERGRRTAAELDRDRQAPDAGPALGGTSDTHPFAWVPEELERQCASRAGDADPAARPADEDFDQGDDEDKPQILREMELMDDLIEHGEGELIGALFDGPVRLPRPEQLDERQVEQALKALLAQLAVFNIALDLCAHYTPRAAYRLLIEEICTEERAYAELRHTQWIQHFTTGEFCAACDAETAREFEEYQQRRAEEGDAHAHDNPACDNDPLGETGEDEIPY